ncbi:MAG: aspartate kinase [Clostridia bacterium]|nr:aspartate kinase [Clostridia bacterium]
MIVCKFGGTSMADAKCIRAAADIVRADKARRYVVVSAPGKRHGKDEKITDLLLRCQKQGVRKLDFSASFIALKDRFCRIVADLGLQLDLEGDFDALEQALRDGASPDYAASRGEYFNARIFAALLGFDFLDAKDLVAFDEKGALLMDETIARLAEAMKKHTRAVIPGFYGSRPDGSVCTFSRGGSDVTGSLAAAAGKAELYENWTDVSGILMADPRVVRDARTIPAVTYQELRELSYMGATVLHEDAVFPVSSRGIPIRICNTKRPSDPGTLIASEAPCKMGTITGIAGKKGFSAIHVDKDRMNAEIGFGRRVLSVLEDLNMSFEHLPSGIDTLSVFLETSEVKGKENEILSGIQAAVKPDRVHIVNGYALIAVVGRGMRHAPGTAARLFSGLAKAGINVDMIDQGSSQINIIVGVEEKDYERALEAIYREFIPVEL